MTAEALKVEAPSGKGAGDENFPVGSFLLPARLRPHVARFYAFARAIDDIADNPDLASDDKIARLDAMEQALTGKADPQAPGLDKAHAIRESLVETDVTTRHCQDLISAFKQDAVKSRYDDWDDLIDYCNRSAAPVGRYLLDLHGDGPAQYPYSDALCNALQVINHLQDCADDHAELNRVYLPGDWMAAEGTDVTALAADAASPEMRRVLDRCIEGVRALLAQSQRLPSALSSRRLALESAVIVQIALRLTDELARRDPIAERIELTKPQFLACALRGVWSALTTRI
ncbi:MAG: squalene synthase HpnC [Hyphomicrobiales bacterium]